MRGRVFYLAIAAVLLALSVLEVYAASLRAGKILSSEQRVLVNKPELVVTVRAEIDSSESIYLDTLKLGYEDVVIEVPTDVLRHAAWPQLDDIGVAYCCEGVYFGEVPPPGRHPSIVVNVPFRGDVVREAESDVNAGDRLLELPFLSVQFTEGQVSGFEIWEPGEIDWNVTSFELVDGSYVEVDGT
ncbi:MAG: hypothetical protein QNJ73_07650 [Gammaproteobacteria bacterium]|nr:hypothetical protein [Gammaproteobacteria bacterium]